MHSRNEILLLWEKDDDLIRMFSLFLKEHDYFMNSVTSLDECLEFCKSKPPILLIMHRFINMKDDNLELVSKLRLHQNISYFPIIVGWADFKCFPDFTYSNKERAYREAFEAGANACFGCTFRVDDILEEIEFLLNNPMATDVIDRQAMQLKNEAKRNG